MNETDVIYESPSSKRNVVRIDTEAMTNGNNARNEAKTNANTANAATPAESVSIRTLGPLEDPPELSAVMPVSPTSSPGSALVTLAWAAAMRGSAPRLVSGGANR